MRGLPLYSPATHLLGFCSVPALQNRYSKRQKVAEAAPCFMTLSVSFAESRFIIMKKCINVVLVTSVGTATSIGVIKNIRKYRPEWKIIGTDINEYGYTAGSILVDEYFKVPYAENSDFCKVISEIVANREVDFIWPINDSEIRKIDGRNICDFILASSEVIRLVSDKLECTNRMVEIGVKTPRVVEAMNECFREYVIRKKASVGSKGIRFVDSVDRPTLSEDEFAQERIVGEEYTVDVLSDRNGKPVYVIPRKRIEVKAGVSTKAQIVNHKDMINSVLVILSAIVLPGFSNIQFIRSNEGVDYFIEVNPRIGGFTSASLLAAPDMFPSFLEIIENGKPSVDKLNNNVNWGIVVTRYYEEVIYDERRRSHYITCQEET